MEQNNPKKTLLSLEQLKVKLPIDLKNNHARREELLSSLRTISTNQGGGSDSADEADLKSEHENIGREINRLASEESSIHVAMQAVKDDNYGYCDCCGIQIPLQRMNSSPFTTQCVDCKHINEVRAAQQSGHRIPSGSRI